MTASAAEPGRRWDWSWMRTSRRWKAWQEAGYISRDAEAIIVTTSVAPTATHVMTPVKLSAFIVALSLACVSAAFSSDGLIAIFAGAFWPVITTGAELEADGLVATAWLTEHWKSAPLLPGLVLVAKVGVLMSLNAIGVFGFLTRAQRTYRDRRSGARGQNRRHHGSPCTRLFSLAQLGF